MHETSADDCKQRMTSDLMLGSVYQLILSCTRARTKKLKNRERERKVAKIKRTNLKKK